MTKSKLIHKKCKSRILDQYTHADDTQYYCGKCKIFVKVKEVEEKWT